MTETNSVARVKAELQSKGIRIPSELVQELEQNWNAPSISSGRLVLCLESPENDGELIPVFIVNGKRGEKSPLYLVKKDTRFEIWKENVKYSDVSIMPRPRFYNNLTSNGVPMHKYAVIVGPEHARSVVNQSCIYQQTGKACKFCAIQNWWDANIAKTPAQVAETIASGYTEGVVRHVSLTTATTNTKSKGLENLVKTAELTQETVQVPIMLEFEPIDDFDLLDSLLKDAKRAGVTTVSCNIECFDESLREEIMPVKGKNPVSMYVKTWEKCIDIFGKNDVFTVVIAGIGEEDASILKGVEIAASLGVMTFLVPHSPTIGAIYENMEAPSSDRMLSLYEQTVSIYVKYDLDLCKSQSGCVRGGGFSAIKDVARFGV